VFVDDEARPRPACPVLKQTRRGLVCQRGDAPRDFTRDSDRFSARGDDRECAAAPQQLLSGVRGRGDEVLAVVEHDEHRIVADVVGDGLDLRARRLVRQPHRPRDRRRHKHGVGEGREFDVPNAVFEVGDGVSGELKREAGLTCAASASEREEPTVPDQAPQFGEFGFAADETGQLHWQVVRKRVKRAQWRELGV
jgi:hypothetical protein